MKVACVLIDHLPFKLEAERTPELSSSPVIIFQRIGSQRMVLDASPQLNGVSHGMPLQEALSRCRGVSILEADLPRYEREFAKLSARLEDFSPVVEATQLGCIYVGLGGLEQTYGGDGHLIIALLQSSPPSLKPRLGIGSGKFPAYVAALSAQPGRAFKPPQQTKEFLGPFSVDVLPVSWKVKERLFSYGLDTLGKVAELPIGPMQSQFGPVGVKIWRLSQGIDDSPLCPQKPEFDVSASFAFPIPTMNIDPLLLAIDHLLAKLFAQPEMRGRCARIAFIEGQVYRKPAWQRRIAFKTPIGNRRRAYFVIKSSLYNVTLPGALEEVRLTLRELVGEAGLQESLFREVRERERLHQAIDQLKASQGINPIYQVREVEPWSRVPERRRALVTYEP